MRHLPLLFAIVGSALLSGCVLAKAVGGALQNEEYQKKIEVLPKYNDLSGQRVAVLVDADLGTLYDYPDLIAQITGGVSVRISAHVPNVEMLNPDSVMRWQYKTPMWNAMPYGDIAKSLKADRVIYIDVYEYRLNPPGNRYLWEGVCAANIHIIERDFLDPDMFADSFEVTAEFPTISHVDRNSATQQAIETGVLYSFVQRVSWLFYTHLEPKYPDKYRPEMDLDRQKK